MLQMNFLMIQLCNKSTVCLFVIEHRLALLLFGVGVVIIYIGGKKTMVQWSFDVFIFIYMNVQSSFVNMVWLVGIFFWSL